MPRLRLTRLIRSFSQPSARTGRVMTSRSSAGVGVLVLGDFGTGTTAEYQVAAR